MDSRRSELKREWRTVAAAAFGSCVGLTGLGFYSFGLFVKPLQAEFGWSRSAIGLGMSVITVGTVLMSPLIGGLIDRYGGRRLALASVLGIGLAYGSFAGLGGSILGFYACCLAIAILGCATSPVTWTGFIASRFERGLGLALGLTMLGSATAGLLSGPVLQAVMLAGGWRAGYLTMAGVALVIALPVIWAFLPKDRERRDQAVGHQGLTLAQAVRTYPFWAIALGILLLITAQSGVMIHMAPMLSDRGLSPMLAASLIGVMGISTFLSRVAVGALLDRFNPPLVAAVALVAPVIAAALLSVSAEAWAATAAAVLLGLSADAETDLLAFFATRYFGRRAYGRIFGLLFMMFSLGNGFGAPLVGLSFDRTGGYGQAMAAASLTFLLGAALFASLRWAPTARERLSPSAEAPQLATSSSSTAAS